MRFLTITLCLLLLATDTFAASEKDKREVGVAIQEGMVRIKYKVIFDSAGNLLTCLDVFEWIGFSEAVAPPSLKNMEALQSTLTDLKLSCSLALNLGHNNKDYVPGLEKLVSEKIISEELYLYFVHSLMFARVMGLAREEKIKRKVLNTDLKGFPAYYEGQLKAARETDISTVLTEGGVSKGYIKSLAATYNKIKKELEKVGAR